MTSAARELHGHRGAVLTLLAPPAAREESALLYSGSADGSVRVWDTRTLKSARCLLTPNRSPVTSIALGAATATTTGRQSSSSYVYVATDNHVLVYDLRQDAQVIIRAPVHQLDAFEDDVNQIVVHKHTMAVADDSGAVTVYDTISNERRRVLRHHTNLCSSLSFANHRLVSGGMDCVVCMWDYKGRGRPQHIWHAAAAATSSSLSSSSSSTAASRTTAATKKKRTATQQRLARRFKQQQQQQQQQSNINDNGGEEEQKRIGPPDRQGPQVLNPPFVHALATTDTHVAAALGNGEVVIWSVKNEREEVYRLYGHWSGVCSITYMNNCTRLASAGNDQHINIWSLGNDDDDDANNRSNPDAVPLSNEEQRAFDTTRLLHRQRWTHGKINWLATTTTAAAADQSNNSISSSSDILWVADTSSVIRGITINV